jgi:hypothetical protein
MSHGICKGKPKDILQPTGEYSPSLAFGPTLPAADIFLLTPAGKSISYLSYRVYIQSVSPLRPQSRWTTAGDE